MSLSWPHEGERQSPRHVVLPEKDGRWHLLQRAHGAEGELAMPKPLLDATCPLCRLAACMQGQSKDAAQAVLGVMMVLPCQCYRHPHAPRVAHPHTQAGCQGYGKAGVHE